MNNKQFDSSETEVAFLRVGRAGKSYKITVIPIMNDVGNSDHLDYEVFIEGEHRFTIFNTLDENHCPCWKVKWSSEEVLDNDLLEAIHAQLESYYL